jgi:hypothetical protein
MSDSVRTWTGGIFGSNSIFSTRYLLAVGSGTSE